MNLSMGDGPDNRCHGRLRCESLESNLGVIVNLSGTGVRVRRLIGRGPAVGREVRLAIRSRFGELRVPARVVWVKRLGLGYEAGLALHDLNEMARTILADVAREHHDRRVMGRTA